MIASVERYAVFEAGRKDCYISPVESGPVELLFFHQEKNESKVRGHDPGKVKKLCQNGGPL